MTRQIEMFTPDQDMPLWTGTPMKGIDAHFIPQPVGDKQASFARCPVCLDTGQVEAHYCWCEAGIETRKAHKALGKTPSQRAIEIALQAGGIPFTSLGPNTSLLYATTDGLEEVGFTVPGDLSNSGYAVGTALSAVRAQVLNFTCYHDRTRWQTDYVATILPPRLPLLDYRIGPMYTVRSAYGDGLVAFYSVTLYRYGVPYVGQGRTPRLVLRNADQKLRFARRMTRLAREETAHP